METFDNLPPISSADPPPDCFSTVLVNLGKRYGHGKRRFAVFLPRAIWPVPSVHHNHAYGTDVDFMRENKEYKKAPNSKIKAVVPLPKPTSTTDTTPAPLLIHYHPNTPYVLHVARGLSLGPHDAHYYLERGFGHCLIDRTKTLTRRAPAKVLYPLPAFEPDFSASMDELCDRRATEICARAKRERRQIWLLWSGGIDSTAAAVALLKALPIGKWKSLEILFTRSSQVEYPKLFKWLHWRTTLRFLENGINDLFSIHDSSLAMDKQPLIVTGEFGDQLFGSMVAECFYEKKENGEHLYGKQNEPWREFVNTLFTNPNIIPSSSVPAMVRYLEPQVACSPVPIVNAYDFLWWLNFSMKCQHVGLRIPLLVQETTQAKLLIRMERTVHFFESDYFQQWSYHNHDKKMKDPSDWSTYKAPLKEYIFAFTKDKEYFENKKKERSLRVAKTASEIDVNVIGHDENFHPISFGISSICLTSLVDKYGSGTIPLPSTDTQRTVIADGPEWEATSEARACYMKKMELHRADVSEQLKKKKKKLRNKVKRALHVFGSSSTWTIVPPCEERDDWRYWLFTHETDNLHNLSDISLVSTLFNDTNSDLDAGPSQTEAKSTVAGASAHNGHAAVHHPMPKLQQGPVGTLPTTAYQNHRYSRTRGGYTGYKSKTKCQYGGMSFE